jgi:hypothetical protein
VLLRFLRNEERAPRLRRGQPDRYQQRIEPAGLYVLSDDDPSAPLARGWVRGRIAIDSPLVIEWNVSGSGRYDEGSWKAALRRELDAGGEALSRKLRRLGYDAIVTVDEDGRTSEIVLLRPDRASWS